MTKQVLHDMEGMLDFGRMLALACSIHSMRSPHGFFGSALRLLGRSTNHGMNQTRFGIDGGAAMSVASTMVPAHISKPFSARWTLMVGKMEAVNS